MEGPRGNLAGVRARIRVVIMRTTSASPRLTAARGWCVAQQSVSRCLLPRGTAHQPDGRPLSPRMLLQLSPRASVRTASRPSGLLIHAQLLRTPRATRAVVTAETRSRRSKLRRSSSPATTCSRLCRPPPTWKPRKASSSDCRPPIRPAARTQQSGGRAARSSAACPPRGCRPPCARRRPRTPRRAARHCGADPPGSRARCTTARRPRPPATRRRRPCSTRRPRPPRSAAAARARR